jgi:hypothetical protein
METVIAPSVGIVAGALVTWWFTPRHELLALPQS